MLHILRHSPHAESSFASCLRTISPGQSLLLIEDSVYSLLPGTSSRNALDSLPDTLNLYALDVDLEARGLVPGDVPARTTIIDYARMVELTIQHTKVVSW